MQRALVISSILAIAATSCVGPNDDPTTVRDLRVLGMQLEPPEVLIDGCDTQLLQSVLATAQGGPLTIPPDFQAKLALAGLQPLQFTALIADPKGEGRLIDYELRACAERSDRSCGVEEPGAWVSLGRGTTSAGHLTQRLNALPLQFLEIDGGVGGDGGVTTTPLIFEVAKADTFGGLGGIRIPLVLRLYASDTGEEIFAQKLMPYVCKFFPTMKQNVQPILPGMTLRDAGWSDTDMPLITGPSEIPMEPMDFTSLQEDYVVPSFQLQPVSLTESWKIAHYTTAGTFSPYETGGTELDGVVVKPFVKWTPPQAADAEEQDVTFWFVVRDGRGGQSWLKRSVHWKP